MRLFPDNLKDLLCCCCILRHPTLLASMRPGRHPTQGGPILENIAPTQGPLTQHIKRAVHHAVYVWCQAMGTQPDLLSPVDWSWQHTDHDWPPRWTNLPDVGTACYEHCGCKKTCRAICNCFPPDLRSTALWELQMGN